MPYQRQEGQLSCILFNVDAPWVNATQNIKTLNYINNITQGEKKHDFLKQILIPKIQDRLYTFSIKVNKEGKQQIEWIRAGEYSTISGY